MSETAVHDILDRIKNLPPQERLLFDQLLAREEEKEWRTEAEAARRQAREKGIDEAVIDRAVRAVRQGG